MGGGSGSSNTIGYADQIANYASGHLPDDAQRDAALKAAKELKTAGSEDVKAAANAAKAVDKIAEERSARPEDFQRALSEMRGYSEGLQTKVIEERFRLKSQLTREQWAILHSEHAVH